MVTNPLSGICIMKYLLPVCGFFTLFMVFFEKQIFSSLSQIGSIFLCLSLLTIFAWGWGVIDRSESFVPRMVGQGDKNEGSTGTKAELGNASQMSSPNNYPNTLQGGEGLRAKVTATSSYMLILLLYMYFQTQAQAQLIYSNLF